MVSLKDLKNTKWGQEHLIICGLPEKKEENKKKEVKNG